ncbi:MULTISPECIES: TIGR03086 family metal-binding protein [Micromonospora]|uniref:TIGR03086 family protein n=1 Tax=Micromonospora yangpuensis TaxID=683228 RepID=A0A1C6TZ26_9ACTN|nr:TIGR03086 family metal-binding protein [Micromonospora yangpuensis]SCL46923.1 TIGR03086 family protein [Micromonospora yangpuensis]
MTTEIGRLLGAAGPGTVAVVRGTADGQFDLPTPCAEFRVRDLVNHLFEVVVNFQALAVRQPVDWAEKPDFLTGDWRERFEVETDRVVRAWSDPAALEGTSPMMGMPQQVVGGMILMDLIVHGWDLAAATGQPYDPAPETLPPSVALIAQLAPQGRQYGVFGAEVATGPDAPELDRLLGLAGRNPAWGR